MKRGTKIALGVTGILLLGCLTGFFFMLNDALHRIDAAKEQSEIEANELLILAASHWEFDDVAIRTSPEFMDEATGRKKFSEWNETYGTLTTGTMKRTSFHIADKDLKDTTMVAEFAAVAEFAKGKGRVSMTLTRKPRNAWELAKLDISPVP